MASPSTVGLVARMTSSILSLIHIFLIRIAFLLGPEQVWPLSLSHRLHESVVECEGLTAVRATVDQHVVRRGIVIRQQDSLGIKRIESGKEAVRREPHLLSLIHISGHSAFAESDHLIPSRTVDGGTHDEGKVPKLTRL